jgi:hypothetical protein
MKIGILVNTGEHLDDILGIVSASLKRGHEVEIFAMDSGTKLLSSTSFCSLSDKAGVSMSFCELSATQESVSLIGLNPGIISGSQYNNACMFHKSDRVIVL